MSRRPRKTKADESEADTASDAAVSEASSEPSPAQEGAQDTKPAPLRVPAPAPKPTPAVSREPTITVERFSYGMRKYPQGIIDAFVSCERRLHGTRKLTKAEWETFWNEFLRTPR